MQFYKLSKMEEETMHAHFNKFKAIKQQLLGVKKDIPEDEAIAVLLNSVDKPPYDSIVSTLQNLEKTLQEVEASLLEYESKNKTTSASTSSKESVFYTRGRGGYRGRGRGGFNGRGRGQGHGREGGAVTCHNCGTTGHYARNCWYQSEQANYVEEAPPGEKTLDTLF